MQMDIPHQESANISKYIQLGVPCENGYTMVYHQLWQFNRENPDDGLLGMPCSETIPLKTFFYQRFPPFGIVPTTSTRSIVSNATVVLRFESFTIAWDNLRLGISMDILGSPTTTRNPRVQKKTVPLGPVVTSPRGPTGVDPQDLHPNKASS